MNPEIRALLNDPNSKYSNPWYRVDDESILEIYDIQTNTRTVLHEFNTLIEAPNWSVDGKCIYYNSNGKIYQYDAALFNANQAYPSFPWDAGT